MGLKEEGEEGEEGEKGEEGCCLQQMKLGTWQLHPLPHLTPHSPPPPLSHDPHPSLTTLTPLSPPSPLTHHPHPSLTTLTPHSPNTKCKDSGGLDTVSDCSQRWCLLCHVTIGDEKHITRGEGGCVSHTHWTTPTLSWH